LSITVLSVSVVHSGHHDDRGFVYQIVIFGNLGNLWRRHSTTTLPCRCLPL